MYYVYAYLDPRKDDYTLDDGERLDHEPFYIGKGKGKRAWCHLDLNHRSNTNKMKKGKIQRIYDAGFIPKVILLAEGLSEDEAMLIERTWISRIGTKWRIPTVKRGPLYNMTDGGDGYTPCDELRALHSRNNKGTGNPMYGRTHSESARTKIREQSKKLKHSDETKANMSRARAGGNNYNAKHWSVMLPDQSVVTVTDLRLFAKNHGINYNTLYNTMVKKKPATSGYWLLGPITQTSNES